jgi:hypothetical protein
LNAENWSEAVTRTEQLLLAAPEDDVESRLLLGIGLAITTRLETPSDVTIPAVSDLPESGSWLLEQFRNATADWLAGTSARCAFSFSLRPTSTPLEASLMRAFIAGPVAYDARDALELGLDAAWVVLPSGERLSLSAKPAMRRLLMALIEGHRIGASLTTDELFEGGWPKESIRSDSARNRVRVALSRLRKAGFAELLERTPDGMRLRPSLEIVLAELS